jgi:NADH dehydrogenase
LPHIVIIGGGFGGLYAAQSLAGQPVRITLIDRRNHHLFQPLLFQVATAQLEPADIAQPIRELLAGQRNARVLLGEVTDINPDSRVVELEDGQQIGYDFLILAAGASHNYFGNDHFAKFAPGIKSIEDALDIRRRVFGAFDLAETTTDPVERERRLTFVVVGAGPTGVELAGSIAEIAHQTLSDHEYTQIDPSKAKVYLVEALPRVLPPFPEDLSRAAHASLEKLGVTMKLNGLVNNVDENRVTIGKDPGEMIPARTVVWSAGVKGSPLAACLGAELDRAGRAIVRPDLSVPGHPEIFVVGDLAAAQSADGKPVPGVAPAAMQMGTHAAANIMLSLHHAPTRPFRYTDRGNLAIIARNEAVADVRGRHFSGVPAWFLWLGVHAFYLPGIMNKLSVTLTWLTCYIGNRRTARAYVSHV